jgi:hypothetical protein
MIPVTRLKNLGLITNEGSVVNFTLTPLECLTVIQRLRAALTELTAEEYLRIQGFTAIFPECIVYQIIRDNKVKLMDALQ